MIFIHKKHSFIKTFIHKKTFIQRGRIVGLLVLVFRKRAETRTPIKVVL